jgi:hypothetical protein
MCFALRKVQNLDRGNSSLPLSDPSHSLSTLLRLCKISREEEIKVRLDTKNENGPRDNHDFPQSVPNEILYE